MLTSKPSSRRLSAGLFFAIIILALGGCFLNTTDLGLIGMLRLPRVLFALVGGMGLGVSALLFQATLRSPYLDGSMLGVGNAAEFVAACAIVLVPNLTSARVLVGAVIGACYLVALRASLFKLKARSFFIIIGGLAAALMLSAATELVTEGSGFEGKSLSTTTWLDVWFLAIVFLAGLIILVWQAKSLKFFALPPILTRQMDFNEQAASFWIQLVAAAWLGAVATVLGTVFFVGIVLVQLIKHMVKEPLVVRLHLTALLGACLVLAADDLAHFVLPNQELPTNAMLMLLVGPLVLFVIGRWRHEL